MNPTRGIALKIASVVVFMAMVTCIKTVSIHVPTGEAVFFRSFFAIPVILVWLCPTRAKVPTRPHRSAAARIRKPSTTRTFA